MDRAETIPSHRIFLIHATLLAIAPINRSFKKLWPSARLSNLLDDSLATDLQATGTIDQAMRERFIKLGRYAYESGASGIIFTCSAFGPAISACKSTLPIPVLRPNEAMIEEAMSYGDRIALISTFEPSLPSITSEFHEHAASIGRRVTIRQIFVPGALTAAQEGDSAKHDELVSAAVNNVNSADAIAFAQFSMTEAADACARISGKSVLTTPDSAVRLMRKLVSPVEKR